MEAVSYINGEDWGDEPQCVCPVIAVYCRVLNDMGGVNARKRLASYIPMVVGTRSPSSENTRARVATRAALATTNVNPQATLMQAFSTLDTVAHYHAKMAAFNAHNQNNDLAAERAVKAVLNGAGLGPAFKCLDALLAAGPAGAPQYTPAQQVRVAELAALLPAA